MEARYEERIKACKTEEELAEYLLLCVPVLREYTSGVDGKKTTKKVANLDVEVKKGVQRQDIYNKYLEDVENIYTETPVPVDNFTCPQCKKKYTRIIDEISSDEICQECGATFFYLGSEMGFKEEQEMEKNVVYSYKRENHFNEWISQFQAKESTHVPEIVIENLRSEFKKQKIRDVHEITHEKVKGLLKKLNFSKYYEHVPYIATILSGITPPTMPQELEDKLRIMFYAIQAPFEKHKPTNRKNFLSYSFVLYKMCELLEEDQYLPCFPLLKSREKLYVQDRIWEKICTELRWQFIPTC